MNQLSRRSVSADLALARIIAYACVLLALKNTGDCYVKLHLQLLAECGMQRCSDVSNLAEWEHFNAARRLLLFYGRIGTFS